MGTEGYMRENDPERAHAMADFSKDQHVEAQERKAEFPDEAKRLEREAYKAEMQAGAQYDAQKEIEGLGLEDLRVKFREAADAENAYAKSNLDAGNMEYTKDVAYLQLATRRGVLEKAAHEMERSVNQ
jgi:hypothetical protein